MVSHHYLWPRVPQWMCQNVFKALVASSLVLKNHSDMSAETRVARGSDGKPYPQSSCSWKVKYTKWQKWFNS